MMFKNKQTVGHRTVLKLAALSQALLLMFVGMTASAQEGNRLQDIQVQSLPGQRVELRLIMSGTAPEPLAFTIDNPARIALDLPDTLSGQTLKLAALSQALLLMFVGMTASAQEGNRLQDIQVQSLPGQRVELRLIMSGTAPEPLAFTIDNPARIALDLPDTALGLTSRRRDVNLGPLATILTAEANGRTRVVLNLEQMVSYETRRSGNTVIITLGDGESYDEDATEFASVAKASSPQTSKTNRRSVTARC